MLPIKIIIVGNDPETLISLESAFNGLEGALILGKTESPSRMSINLGNERVFIKLSDIFYIEKTGRYSLIYSANGKFKTQQTLQEMEKHLGNNFFRSHRSYLINIELMDRIVTCPNSSYYEIKFKNYDSRALLSRNRLRELMAYSHYNI